MPILVSFLLFSLSAAALDLGAPLPDFSLPGVDDKTHTAASYADAKVLVLIFTCNHCPTAQAYEERIVKLDADYRARGVRMLAISPNDDKAVRLDELGYSDLGDSLEDMRIRAAEQGWTFPYLYDGETQAFSAKLAVRATPHVFIFDQERKLRYNGRIDDAEVGEPTVHSARDAIDDLLAGRDVRAPMTRTFGCSTKWASKRSGVQAAADKWAKLPVELSLLPAATATAFAATKPGQMRMVTVWATWCGPCVVEFPEFVRIQRKDDATHISIKSARRIHKRRMTQSARTCVQCSATRTNTQSGVTRWQARRLGLFIRTHQTKKRSVSNR